MPSEFADSAIQHVWPYTKMQASAVHGNIPQNLYLSSLNIKTRGGLSKNSLKIHMTTFVFQQPSQYSYKCTLVLFTETR